MLLHKCVPEKLFFIRKTLYKIVVLHERMNDGILISQPFSNVQHKRARMSRVLRINWNLSCSLVISTFLHVGGERETQRENWNIQENKNVWKKKKLLPHKFFHLLLLMFLSSSRVLNLPVCVYKMNYMSTEKKKKKRRCTRH